jgi:hypothetical protein
VAIDDGRGHIEELAVGIAGVDAKHVEGSRLVDRVALHQDALCTLSDSPTSECTF